jgi:hypothetical protein
VVAEATAAAGTTAVEEATTDPWAIAAVLDATAAWSPSVVVNNGSVSSSDQKCGNLCASSVVRVSTRGGDDVQY